MKLARRRPRISYLVYPDFDRVGHPTLAEVIVADLSLLALHHRDHRHSPNPPVLHRKELYTPPDHPDRSRFARLTAQEEALGLLADKASIGTQAGWRRVLERHHVRVRGHRVVQAPSP